MTSCYFANDFIPQNICGKTSEGKQQTFFPEIDFSCLSVSLFVLLLEKQESETNVHLEKKTKGSQTMV